MKIQKWIAITMLLSQAAAYSFITNTKKFVVIILVIAFIGVWDRTNFALKPRNKYIIFFLSAIVTATMLAFSNVDYPLSLAPVFNDFTVHFIIHYLLILQVIGFFILSNSRPTSLQPLYGIIVMVFAGYMQVDSRQSLVFLLCSIGFVISASLFTTFSRSQAKRDAKGLQFPLFRSGILFGIFLALTAITWFSSRFLKDMDDILMNIMKPGNVSVSTGFSNRAELGSIVYKKSRMENKVILRLFTRRNLQYFRAKAYNVYKSSTWNVKSVTTTILPGANATKNIPSIEEDQNLFIIKESKTADWAKTQVWASHASNEVMFMPLHSKIISASFMKLEVNEDDIIISKGLHEKRTYTAYSNLDNSPTAISELNMESLTQIPNDLEPGVISLSNKLFKGCSDAGSKIEAVKRYFINKYEYKLGIKIPENRDPLSYFLLEKPPAHCEYFATGTAILLRLAGVPCRYVSGFMATEWNHLGEYWIARNRDAHAWVEAYDKKTGWVIVETTPPEGVPTHLSQGKIAYAWDYIKHYYQVIRTNLNVNGLRRFISMSISFFTELSHPLFYALIIGMSLTLCIFFGYYFWKRIHKRDKQISPDENPLINSLRQLLTEMDQRLKTYGLTREPYETIHQFADRIAIEKNDNDLFAQSSRWYKDYALVRYGEKVNYSDLESLKAQMP